MGRKHTRIGELRNGRKFKCNNKPFIVLVLILTVEGVCFTFGLFTFNLNLQPLG